MDLVCTEINAPVPWELVAHKINDHVSGEGIKQHLAKVRKYREMNGRPVPQKGIKIGGGRQSAASKSDTMQRKSKKKGGLELGDAPVPGPGASLLWTDPRDPLSNHTAGEHKEVLMDERIPKSKKNKARAMDGEAPTAPKTPAKRSRQSGSKDDQRDDGVSKRSTTGKRSRIKKEAEEDSDFCVNESPTKKQKQKIHLRATTPVNYAEHQDIDEFNDDVFDARNNNEDADDDCDDAYYGSQPGTGRNTAGCEFARLL